MQTVHEKAIQVVALLRERSVSSYHLLNHVHLEFRLHHVSGRSGSLRARPTYGPRCSTVLSAAKKFQKPRVWFRFRCPYSPRSSNLSPFCTYTCLPGHFCIEVLPSKPSSSNCKLNSVRSPSIQPLHIYFVGSPNLSFGFFR
jgi:hypothetical protein